MDLHRKRMADQDEEGPPVPRRQEEEKDYSEIQVPIDEQNRI